ncbi:hypothetical protein HYALB_00013655 [Hymenoscyphus albidus]|uniref:Pre-rRNA-processing protein RIX1 n=1 Tax=Hymenoscyphus albidus TaxID=595503 RepID=A0A9N9M2G0_9HELO|nr:hypothetical protein HYALB_00013655 [Hymenoscyphus albidus]
MSLPSELRILCFKLSSTPVAELPRLIPTLQHYVIRCQGPLSSPPNSGKADASPSAVLVHKLKTQLSTLLNGRSLEGRFAAVILIKGVIEVGGWEVLRGAESWARGLLSILEKSNLPVLKELCIVALTKIYSMTHQYPTLVREITTPTLSAYVDSCLKAISGQDVPSSLIESVFQSFASLLPHHTTTFRPFTFKLRAATRLYLAPTLSGNVFVPSSLQESARHLVVLIPLTAPKASGKDTTGEEWAKAVRELIKTTHVTADSVFRAVVEDWESSTDYIGESVDINRELSGGGDAAEDFPAWTGVTSGVERLVGLVGLLAEYCKAETSTHVCIPLGAILDLVSRILSIAVPSSDGSSGQGNARLHPAIDRDERDGLWCGMPEIYITALDLIQTLAGRLQEGFVPIAQEILDQIVWLFPFAKSTTEFRTIAYAVTSNILVHTGQSFDKTQTGKVFPIIRACCKDLQSYDDTAKDAKIQEGLITGKKSQFVNQNADSFLQSKQPTTLSSLEDTPLTRSAKSLLPLFLSHLPQQHIDISLRALLERTAILAHQKDAMLASILNPFVGKNGKAMASILPHLTREFPEDDVVEILLRPRMPLVSSGGLKGLSYDAENLDEEDEDMGIGAEDEEERFEVERQIHGETTGHEVVDNQPGLGFTKSQKDPFATGAKNGFSTSRSNTGVAAPSSAMVDHLFEASKKDSVAVSQAGNEDVAMDGGEESSDDESVHLTMQLDTDSEDE